MSPNQLQVGGDHYRAMKIQPEWFIYENGIGYHEGNAIKYLCRWRRKAGVQDLQKAKHYIDLLIAHQDVVQEKDEAPQPAPAPLTPSQRLLNTGWKWAEVGHVITIYDKWDGRFNVFHEHIGTVLSSKNAPIATPDWHNPEGIAEPGEGWRFLVKGERRKDATHYQWNDEGAWVETPARAHYDDTKVENCAGATYRTPATRPLPPVLDEEKGGQP